jgi:hypothetical protein
MVEVSHVRAAPAVAGVDRSCAGTGQKFAGGLFGQLSDPTGPGGERSFAVGG